MSVFDNQRPGVYSSYTVSPSYGAPRSALAAAIVARAASSLAGSLLSFSSYAEAAAALDFSPENAATLSCAALLFKSGVSRVYLSAVDDAGGAAYENALALIEDENGIGAVVCDASVQDELDALKVSVLKSSGDMRERIAFAGIGNSTAALEFAAALNCERVVICCPASVPEDSEAGGAIYSAAAMAGAVISQNDPVYNWNGAELKTLSSCSKLPESEIQKLIAAGVTVLEENYGSVCCIRAVTTKTKTGGIEDNGMRSLNSILIIDEVMRTVRDSLRLALTGARLSMESVASQVTIVLSSCRDSGLIEDFDIPIVRQEDGDPSVCVVQLGFKIAHVLSQIHISAHIII